MKKLLIATAALAMVAGTAQAQSSVSVYGILSTGYESMELKNSAGDSIKQTTTGRQGAQSGSRLGFRGTEDLGGGTTAGFVYELGVDMNTAFGTAPRLAFLDLANKDLGTLRAGRVDSLTRQVVNGYTSHGNSGFEAGNTAASFGRVATMAQQAALNANNNLNKTVAATDPQKLNALAIAQQAADVALLTWGQTAPVGRTSNTIGYISPSMGGFQFQAQIGKVEADTSGIDNKTVAQDTQAFGVSYNAGALSLMAATSTEKSKSVELGGAAKFNAGDVKIKTDIFGAAYDFKVAKAFAMYTDREIKRENASLVGAGSISAGAFGAAASGTVAGTIGMPAKFQADQKDTTLGVTVPVGAKVVLVGSYSMGDIKFGGLDKTDVDGYQLQANYNFSKRTKAYVMYGESKLKSTEGTDKLKGYVAGVQHSF